MQGSLTLMHCVLKCFQIDHLLLLSSFLINRWQSLCILLNQEFLIGGALTIVPKIQMLLKQAIHKLILV